MADRKMLMGREISREEFEQMKQMMAGPEGRKMAEAMEAMAGAFGAGPGEPETKLLNVPAPANADEKTVRAALERVKYGYADSWFDKLRIEIDLFWVPNPEMIAVCVDWAGGVSPSEEPRFDSKQLVYTCEVPCADGQEAAVAASLKGTLKVSTAATVKEIVLRKADIGKAKDGWTLTKLEGNTIALRKPAGADDAVIAAFDDQGHRLDWQSTGNEVVHSSGKPLWELEWDDLTDEKMSFVYTAAHCGRPAEVRVYRPDKRVSLAVPLTVVLGKKTGDGPPAEVRFARGRTPKFVELTEKQVQEQTAVGFRRSTAMMEAGQPTLSLRLPANDNSAYATVAFEDFRLSGDHGEITGFETVNGGMDFETVSVNRRFTPADGNMEFPGLKRIRGSATVRYPLKVQVIRGKAGEAGPVTIGIEGGRISVAFDPEKVPGLEAQTESFLPDDMDRIVARHESGLYLKRLPFQGFHSTEEGTRRELEYWGTPAEVEVRIPMNYVEFTVPIDVTVT